jgi:hypothetical protein
MDISLSYNFDPLASYAAILSTIIAIWEFIKWRSRNEIEVLFCSDMVFVPPKDKNNLTYIVANVTNKGQTATTITHFALYYWKNKIDKFFKKNGKIVKNIPTNNSPNLIEPGQQWIGEAIQTKELEHMACEGCLYGVIVHSMGKKQIMKRIKTRPPKLNPASSPR